MLGGNRKNLIPTTGLGSVVLGMGLPGPKRSGTGLAPRSPADPWAQRARRKQPGNGGGWAVAANSDASDGRPRTGRRSRLLVLWFWPAWFSSWQSRWICDCAIGGPCAQSSGTGLTLIRL